MYDMYQFFIFEKIIFSSYSALFDLVIVPIFFGIEELLLYWTKFAYV